MIGETSSARSGSACTGDRRQVLVLRKREAPEKKANMSATPGSAIGRERFAHKFRWRSLPRSSQRLLQRSWCMQRGFLAQPPAGILRHVHAHRGCPDEICSEEGPEGNGTVPRERSRFEERHSGDRKEAQASEDRPAAHPTREYRD